jgi:hypothetical protein
MLVDTLEETVEYAHAGHPPIVVVNQDGTARTLENGRGALLGVAPFHVQAGRLHLDGVEAAVLYTDGLVERRGEPLDLCIDRLVDLLGVRLTCEEILDRCAGHGPAEDDTIVVRLDFAPVPRRLGSPQSVRMTGAPGFGPMGTG